MRGLAEFGMFHPDQPQSQTYDPLLNDLSSRAFKVQITLRDLLRDLNLTLEPGILEILRRGYHVDKDRIEAADWTDFIEEIEAKATPLIEQIRKIKESIQNIEKRVSGDADVANALELLSKISIDFGEINNLRKFMIGLVIVENKDVREIEKSLPSALIRDAELTASRSILVIATQKANNELVDKVLKSFDIEFFSIPKDLPQNPAEAFGIVSTRLDLARSDLEEARQSYMQMVSQNSTRLLSLYEAASLSFSSMETMKRTGNLSRFAIISGYIPTALAGEFSKRFDRWILFTEPITAQNYHDDSSKVPTLMKNPRIVSAFEGISLNQGPPSYGEIDPTPVISFAFPLFYGMMFGDVGHGIILSLFGLLLIYRKAPSLVRWGQLLLLAGISATIMGLIIGEVFGLEIASLVPAFGHPLIEFVERVNVIPSINVTSLKLLLKISILFGIGHLFIGNFINIANDLKNREYDEAITESIPHIIMYSGFVLLIFAFLGTGFDVNRIFVDPNPTPLFFFLRTIPIASVAQLATFLLVGGLIGFVLGKPILILAGRAPKESIAMAIMVRVIDGAIEKIAGFLSNTLSYTRLAILLTVHTALLIVVNLLWGLPLALAIPLVIVFNILVMLMEGMIVYIQDIRLHLYEWFTKFYSGTGIEFRSLFPRTIRTELVWREKEVTSSA